MTQAAQSLIAPSFKGSGVKDLFYYHELTSLYYQHDLRDLMLVPVNAFSNMAHQVTTSPFLPLNYTHSGRTAAASFEIMERLTHRYRKPSFNIEVVTSSDGSIYEIKEKVLTHKPFCRLLHFERTKVVSEGKKSSPKKQARSLPKVLIVPPYSGHYATLLRDTIRTMLKDHEVYVTDWENARDVPLHEGVFTLEDYIQYLFDFVHLLNTDLHIMAVCQPAVPVFAMTALMAAQQDARQPKSIILIGGPIDTRISPTEPDKIAKASSLEWFKMSVIARVPHYYKGAFRRVVPGFLLLWGFMSMNLERHLSSSQDLFNHLVQGDEESAAAHRRFYNEYCSVLDLPADYYLDSAHLTFQTYALPKGEMTWKGLPVDPKAIQNTALLTIEGEFDDISGRGQTKAAQDLTPNLPLHKKQHYLQEKVGHYGVFNGHRWREEVAPIVTDFIRKNS